MPVSRQVYIAGDRLRSVAPIKQLVDIQPVVERAILVGTARGGHAALAQMEEHLTELGRLAETAGARVVGSLTQRLDAPLPSHFLGRGKVAVLGDLARSAGATLAVFDEDLSPVQGKNLERALEVRVMDRSELILDIFATRAKSKEARMQVELAQLEYLLPRLARMWVHLSRIRGGIGLRGPGETQLETDRRLIRRKITTLKRKLEDVARHRRVLRAGRREIPTVALVGYTNSGKSSLLRALTGADTIVEDRLFATLDTLTRELVLDGDGGGSRRRVRVVDTVGFIRKLPHHLVASFRATLEEAELADILLHVIDAAHPDWQDQVRVVDEVLGSLDLGDRCTVHVFNKMDRVEDGDMVRRRLRLDYQHTAFVSALRGEVGDLIAELKRLRLPGPVSAGTPGTNPG